MMSLDHLYNEKEVLSDLCLQQHLSSSSEYHHAKAVCKIKAHSVNIRFMSRKKVYANFQFYEASKFTVQVDFLYGKIDGNINFVLIVLLAAIDAQFNSREESYFSLIFI